MPLSSACFQLEKTAEGGFYVSISVDPQEVTTAQSVSLMVNMTYPESFHFDEKTFRRHLMDGINLIAKYIDLKDVSISIPERQLSGFFSQNIVYRLDPLIPGHYFLNFLTLSFVSDKEGIDDVHLLGSFVPVSVSLPLVKHDKIEDLIAPLMPLSKGPLMEMSAENKARFQENPQLLALEAIHNKRQLAHQQFPFMTVIVIGLLISSFLLLRRQMDTKIRSLTHKLLERKTIDPKKEALEAIENLRLFQAKSNLSPSECYIHLSDILRHYIEVHYQIPAKRQTTQEFLQEMSKHSLFGVASKLLLTEFLQSADLVKFAEYPPSAKDCAQAMVAAEKFLENNS